VIIGTTQSAFFSLDRLADFLKTAIPDLKAALNLDGGPVASQAVAVGDVRRKVHGRWELQGAEWQGAALAPSHVYDSSHASRYCGLKKRLNSHGPSSQLMVHPRRH
jgi:hypothetical protein